jgi:hypothetical protein
MMTFGRNAFGDPAPKALIEAMPNIPAKMTLWNIIYSLFISCFLS